MTSSGASQPSILEETERKPRLSDGPWKVVLWDDDFHTYEYVIEMLMDVCQMPWEKA
ncbi:Clp protease ClpS, partial [Leptospira sp. mixed culture ATI2-C-A1]